ncbi:MAG: DUF3168 domain-containing protein [Phycisphaerales bacterium]|nr:MAG: DUF3168 domain-containing protein [Phycisphaerales bacterium]
MSLIDRAIFTHLTGGAVGAIVGDRVHPQMRRSGDPLPAIVYERASGARVQSANGQSGLAHPLYDLTCWGRTPDEAKQLAEAVRLRMSDLDRTTVAGVFIDRVRMEDGDADLIEAQPQNENNRVFGVSLSFRVWHREATPTGA